MLLCSAESDSEEVVVSSSNIDHHKPHGRCSNPTIIIIMIIIITSPTEGIETQQLSFNNKIPLFHLNTRCFKANCGMLMILKSQVRPSLFVLSCFFLTMSSPWAHLVGICHIKHHRATPIQSYQNGRPFKKSIMLGSAGTKIKKFIINCL